MADRYNENAERFAKINSLYDEYSSNFDKDNVENAIAIIRDNIIVTTFETFSSNNIQSEKQNEVTVDRIEKISNADFPDVIVKKVRDCLKYFPQSNACKTGGKFSQYLYVAVDNALNAAKSAESLSNKNAGTKISEHDIRLAKKVKKLDSDLEKLGIVNEQKRNERIEATLNMSIEKVVYYKKMANETSLSLDSKKYDNSEMTLGDSLECKSVDVESDSENKNTLEKSFDIIQEEWCKKKDKLLSEILTVYFLRKAFGKTKENDEDLDDSDILQDNSHVRKLFTKYSFFDQSLVKAFFRDRNFKLLEDQDIGKREGISKSAISKKRERFLEKCRKRLSTEGLFNTSSK